MLALLKKIRRRSLSSIDKQMRENIFDDKHTVQSWLSWTTYHRPSNPCRRPFQTIVNPYMNHPSYFFTHHFIDLVNRKPSSFIAPYHKHISVTHRPTTDPLACHCTITELAPIFYFIFYKITLNRPAKPNPRFLSTKPIKFLVSSWMSQIHKQLRQSTNQNPYPKPIIHSLMP